MLDIRICLEKKGEGVDINVMCLKEGTPADLLIATAALIEKFADCIHREHEKDVPVELLAKFTHQALAEAYRMCEMQGVPLTCMSDQTKEATDENNMD